MDYTQFLLSLISSYLNVEFVYSLMSLIHLTLAAGEAGKSVVEIKFYLRSRGN
jgi:hypothetical protein